MDHHVYTTCMVNQPTCISTDQKWSKNQEFEWKTIDVPQYIRMIDHGLQWKALKELIRDVSESPNSPKARDKNQELSDSDINW